MQAVDNLSRIAWGEKAVASGKADKVPQALAGLLSPDEQVRNRSYWQLDNEVVLQSDLYEAAYFVIPFLVSFLRDHVPYGRDRVYDLLYEITNGEAPPTVMCRTTEGDGIPLKAACTREVKKGLAVYIRDTKDADPLVKQKAKQLVDVVGGEGIICPAGSSDAALDLCLRAIRRYWPQAVFENALTGERVDRYESLSVGLLAEVLVYQNRQAVHEWDKHPSSPSLGNSVIRLLPAQGSMTAAVYEPADQSVRKILQSIELPLKIDMLNRPTETPERRAA
jgi:hypothetical protein